MFFSRRGGDSSDLLCERIGEGKVELIPLIRSQSGQTGIFVARPGIEGIMDVKMFYRPPPASLLSVLPDGTNSREKVQIVLIELEAADWVRMRPWSGSWEATRVQVPTEGLQPRAGEQRTVVACRPLAEWVRTAAEEHTGVFITGDENASSARVVRSTSIQEAVRAQELLRRAQAATQQYRGEPAPKRRRLVVAVLGDAIGWRSAAKEDIV